MKFQNKLSCLKKDISLNLVDAEIFTGYYPINISFWDGGFLPSIEIHKSNG